MDFWNICGRAGRGMKENEGQVLFFAKQCFAEWRRGKSKNFRRQSMRWQEGIWRQWCEEQRARRLEYLRQYGTYQVESGLLSLLRQVVRLWEEKHRSVDVPELCEALANNELDMFATSDEVDLVSVLSTLDGLLIAITEECDAGEITPDTFQDLLCRSLVHLQLTTPAERQTVNHLFSARVRYIRGRFTDRAQRRRFYQLGLPLRDCELIEARRDALLALYLRAAAYETWTVRDRAGHLADIAEFLFQLHEIAPAVVVPSCWRRILELWLAGQTPTAILKDREVSAEGVSAHTLNRSIDDAFAYRLPWGLNSLNLYLKQYAEATDSPWPGVCDYYSSFVKYGVHELVVCWLLALGVPSRAAAARVGNLVDATPDSPEILLRWLRSEGIEQLVAAGLSDADAEMLEIAVRRGGAGHHDWRTSGFTLKLNTTGITGPVPVPGTRVLVEPLPGGEPDEYRLLTLTGQLVRRFRVSSERLARLMAHPEFVTAVVIRPDASKRDVKLHVGIEVI